MKLLFAPEAEEDFRAALEFLAERNPTFAAALGRRIFGVVDQLAAGDFDGPECALTTGERVHSFAVPPVRIYYRRESDALWVLRIYDQRRQPIEK